MSVAASACLGGVAPEFAGLGPVSRFYSIWRRPSPNVADVLFKHYSG
jgi:hypothetical protein